MKLSVVIPTQFKLRPDKSHYVSRALSCLPDDAQIILGIDTGAEVPIPFTSRVEVAESNVPGLSGACNAAFSRVSGDVVAFLEDDDYWSPNFLDCAQRVLEHFDFVSSTMLEVDTNEEIVRINDFPVPSTWFMRRIVLEKVGYFDEALGVHQDNDWLGRLNRTDFKRCHLVECTAPIPSAIACRPWLEKVVKVSHLARHASPFPLAVREVHSDSWMGSIAAGDEKRVAESLRCHAILEERYGFIPW